MNRDDIQEQTPNSSSPPASNGVMARARRVSPTAMAVVIGIAALTGGVSENDLVRDIQRYCTVCWRNARLDPTLWDDCTQEVCCRLLEKARSGELDLAKVLGDDAPERRELVRAIDMVRKRVQRTRRTQSLEASLQAAADHDQHARARLELGEILETARKAVLSQRQDRIIELGLRGWTTPEIASELGMSSTRVSDEKYKALRKLERQLRDRREELGFGLAQNDIPASDVA